MIKLGVKITWNESEKGKVEVKLDDIGDEMPNEVEVDVATYIRDMIRALIKYPEQVQAALAEILILTQLDTKVDTDDESGDEEDE
jgi:hypothetical protein